MKTFLKAQWQQLIMANYEVDPAILKPFQPKGVELDKFEGKTLVSLVGFLFKDTSLFGIPIPFFGTFEEVNLRFYVIRKTENETRRGVVFINESVPNQLVAFVANRLYKEHYTALPTRHQWQFTEYKKTIRYEWKVNSKWNHLQVQASLPNQSMETGSIEQFIFEHYFGYTRIDDHQSLEYQIVHPSWRINQIYNAQVDCDFGAAYGPAFELLNHATPHSVMIAEGSKISVDWRRQPF